MKKFILILCLFLSISAAAQTAAQDARQEKDPGKDFYWNYLNALLYDKANQPKKALDLYDQCLKQAPQSKLLKTLILSDALKTGQQDKYAAVADEVKNFNDDKSLSAYAGYLWSRGRLKDAAGYYQRAVKLNPDNTAAIIQYLTLLRGIDTEGAVSFLADHAEKYPDIAAPFYLEAGNTYAAKKDVDSALAMYEKALLADRRYVPARLARADIFKARRDFPDALKEYKALEQDGKADNDVYMQIGMIEILQKDIPAAKKYFEKILSSDPSNPQANRFMSAISEDEEKYQDAINYLQASKDFNTDAQKQLQAAFYAARLGQKETAEGFLAAAYDTSDGGVEIGYYYAVSLQDLQKHKEAAKVFKEILAKSPDLDKARMMYAVSLEAAGNYKGVEKQMRVLLAKEPENPAVLNALGYALLEQNKKYDEALKLITKSLSVKPDDPAATDSMGWYYFKIKKYDEAEKYLLQAYNADKDPEMAGHLGMLYFEKKDYASAVKYFEISKNEKYDKFLKKAKKKAGAADDKD